MPIVPESEIAGDPTRTLPRLVGAAQIGAGAIGSRVKKDEKYGKTKAEAAVMELTPKQLLARGALIFDSTALAGIGPVAVQGQTLFHVREVTFQALTGGADMDIVFSHITEVLLAEPAVGLDA